MAIELNDDGTMDTVLRCSECGEELRYNYDPPVDVISEREAQNRADDQVFPRTNAEDDAYDDFVAWAIEDAAEDHECSRDADEPQEDDLTTTDHQTFYQDGRIVLQRFGPRWRYYDARTRVYNWLPARYGDDHAAAVRAYMDHVQFWPACWFISDHGNAHRMEV